MVTKDPVEDRIGSIYLPDTAKKMPVTGFVHAHNEGGEIGENLRGKRVVFNKYAERLFTIGEAKFSIIDERDVLAVIEEEDV